MPEKKPQDGAESSETLTETESKLVSAGIASDDPIDPMDEPGSTVPPRPPGTPPEN
jgi:hypothetical protein